MRTFLTALLLFTVPLAKGQVLPEPDTGFPWQEREKYWEDLYHHPDYRNFYKDKNPEDKIREAWEHALQNGVRPENMEDFLQELAEDISSQLLDSFGEEVLNQLMEEVGMARYLDKVYEQLLKTGLPKPVGIPVLDVGMEPAITKGKTPHNLKTMLKLAVEKWLNQEWKKQVEGIYHIQREDLEYRKKVGLIALLKMAELEFEHFLSLEMILPEEILEYATQVQQIYRSAEESLHKGKELFEEFNIAGTGWKIPTQMEELKLLQEGSAQAKATSWEMINQRRKALAIAYLQMATRAQEKAKDLQQTAKQEEHLKMSDGDRLKVQQLVNSYMVDSFRYREKADLLLKTSLKNAGTDQKGIRMAYYHQLLRLKSLAP